jgi:hypothetical protein
LTAVDAANTHIPSDPAELHAVLLVYVWQFALLMQFVPSDTHDDNAV